jgi:ribosomal protein S18 acetylase RimI-like enzyme
MASAPRSLDKPTVRRATPSDREAVAALLHLSAAGMYDIFAGGRERALALIERTFAELGNAHSADVVWVAEVGDEVAGAMAAFPVEESLPRARRFLSLTLRSTPPWYWPRTLWLYWLGGRASPAPPARAFYVDALATGPRARRRGVASALLAAAEREARTRGLSFVALDTTLDNDAARALYASAGFDEVAYKPAAHGLPGFVALVRKLP